MDEYATHVSILVGAALETRGPILEMGCGDYSTPLLASIARIQQRRFLVQSSDEIWAQKFRDIAEVQIVDWKRWEPPSGEWGMAFLDSEESTAGRIERLPALLRCTRLVVLHDADPSMARPRWQACVAGWSVEVSKRYVPWTAVLRAEDE